MGFILAQRDKINSEDSVFVKAGCGKTARPVCAVSTFG